MRSDFPVPVSPSMKRTGAFLSDSCSSSSSSNSELESSDPRLTDAYEFSSLKNLHIISEATGSKNSSSVFGEYTSVISLLVVAPKPNTSSDSSQSTPSLHLM